MIGRCALAGLALAFALPAMAQDQQSFDALMQAGFTIVAAEPISLEATQRMNPSSTGETVLVTLQNGPRSAVCWFNLISWAYMARETLANATLCEVR
jgi:hypothetical protein